MGPRPGGQSEGHDADQQIRRSQDDRQWGRVRDQCVIGCRTAGWKHGRQSVLLGL